MVERINDLINQITYSVDFENELKRSENGRAKRNYVENPEKYHASILCQEMSRMIVNWNLYKIPQIFETEDQLLWDILEYEIFHLAGGAIVAHLFNERIKDLDLFIVSTDIVKVGIILDKIRVYKHKTIKTIVENQNCITIIRNNTMGPPIQIIKRVYESPDRVIGGFDLDICRFIMIDGRTYGTMPAIFSLLNKVIVVNLKCASKNFKNRIIKYSSTYQLKVFFPELRSLRGKYIKWQYRHNILSDYFKINYKHKGISAGILFTNMRQLMRGENDFVYENNEILEPEEFINIHFNNRCRTITMLKNYYRYVDGFKDVKKIMYVNTHSQFTSSFKPIDINPLEFYGNHHFNKLDLVTPEILLFFMILRKNKIPKYIRIIILIRAVENYLAV